MSNLKIDNINNEVQLIMDTKFYGFGAVLQASKDYLDTCWVLLDGDKESKLLIRLKPKSKEIDITTLGYEFINYVLGLMQNAMF